MSITKTVELENILIQDDLSQNISMLWDNWKNSRSGWESEKSELRDFIFATDTSSTLSKGSEEGMPWNNRTTLPKICQIRDNLHANYLPALFPNDDWLKWEAYTLDENDLEKKGSIEAYMSNKARVGGLQTTCSRLLYDYIDYGMAIADVVWSNESKVDPESGETIPGYVGPKLVRVNPLDIVFDPTSVSFEGSPKITRSLMNLGELKMRGLQGEEWATTALNKALEVRASVGPYSYQDLDKVNAYSVDGFGNLFEYFRSGVVEILEFEGTIHDHETDDLLDDYIITIVDRQHVVRKQPIPIWKRGGTKVMTSWRKRPDNLYGMGPLDNLVGLQYRIDHLENAKADAWDLVVTPMWKITGNVEQFDYSPGGTVHVPDNDGDIEPLVKPTEALSVDNELVFMMNLMEEFAGAPKQAMGVRTPGEKTAFEVQSLENAAGRIFQEKITQFEIELLEPALNNMLMLATKHMNTADTIRVMDDDLGVADMMSITKEDITAVGKLRPIGARHFAYRAQLLQNISGVANSGIWPKIERHFSDKELAKLVEDSLQLTRFSLVSDNAALFEQAEAARINNKLQEDVEVEASTPIEEDVNESPVV